MANDAIETLVARWIREDIRSTAAYHVADADGLIKLDAMENPYTWPNDVVDAWLDELRHASLNRYPDPEAKTLTQELRRAMSIADDMQVLLGNGSDELIQMLIFSVASKSCSIMAPEPTFVMYKVLADLALVDFVGVPLSEQDFSLNMGAMRQAIEKHQPAIIFLAYPNNPTANLFSEADVEEILLLAPGLVVLDEAYAPFSDGSFMSKLGVHSNLLVMRTVSKMGLAGLRLGLLAGPAQWLDEINKTRLPYNINELTQVSASFALKQTDLFAQQATAICAERKRMIEALTEMNGLTVYPSQANFILFKVTEGQGNAVFESVKSSGVLIKNMNAAGGPLIDHLRVTVGTPEENTAFLQAVALCRLA